MNESYIYLWEMILQKRLEVEIENPWGFPIQIIIVDVDLDQISTMRKKAECTFVLYI